MDEHKPGESSAEGPVDRWDTIAVLGALALFAGLWLWAGLGVALTVVGGLLLALGVVGARTASASAAKASPGAPQRIGRAA